MYPPSVFTLHDTAQAYGLIRAQPLACLAVNGEHGPRLVQVPLILTEDCSALLGHVARNNPFVSDPNDTPRDAVALFRGADGYISPNWYPSKAEHGRAVPTWNYVSLEVRGALHIDTEPQNMARYLEPLTAQMEAEQAVPWAMSDAPENYLQRLSHGIYGVRLDVHAMSGIRKLSQDKKDTDFNGVVDGLRATANAEPPSLLDEMLLEKRPL